MDDQQINQLVRKVDDLIALCGQLEQENRELKAAAGSWVQEREQLIEKTETARTRVESMIARLKSLEQES